MYALFHSSLLRIEKLRALLSHLVVYHHYWGHHLPYDFTLLRLNEAFPVIFSLVCLAADALSRDAVGSMLYVSCSARIGRRASHGKGINDGIVYLMAMPYILVTVVGVVVYRMMYK